MAKFKTLCPLCQAEIHVYSQWAGQQATCPACNETITVPAIENNYLDTIPRITTCPSCRSTQIVPTEISDRSRRTCTKCGSSFLYMPDISFQCADKLPPDQNGNARIACPYCGRHYVLKYSPHNSLIGCQECMNIFANPDAIPNQSVQKKMPRLLPTPLPTTVPVPIPIQPRPTNLFGATNSINPPPKAAIDDDIDFQQPIETEPGMRTMSVPVMNTESNFQQPPTAVPVRIAPMSAERTFQQQFETKPGMQTASVPAMNTESEFQQPPAAVPVRIAPMPAERTFLQQMPHNAPNGVQPVMQTVLLRPAFPNNPHYQNSSANEQEDEMVTINHRAFNEQPTAVFNDDETSAEHPTTSDKSLLKKFFGN